MSAGDALNDDFLDLLRALVDSDARFVVKTAAGRPKDLLDLVLLDQAAGDLPSGG